MTVSVRPKLQKIAVLGNALPRQCGIATYTSDLSAALHEEAPEIDLWTLAINDTPEGYDYPERVRFELQQDEIESYHRAAEMINLANVDLVCVQHEYGIFGGPFGSHVLALLRDLRVPIVTTLHTVLRDPKPEQRAIMIELAQLSDRLVVMSQRGAGFLSEVYGIDSAKIDLIPHGIPDQPFLDSSFNKDQLHAEGKTVMLTFGLLSSNKGIEDVLMAIPAILEHHPNLVYIVLGATHPHVRRFEGERYRNSLEALVKRLGIEAHVVFENQFVDQAMLATYVGAADLYITPYLNEAQIVSGTLAYTIGAGKAIISTPYWYAKEMLADGCGICVPFHDSAAIAREVIALLDNEEERDAMRKRAYMRGREMTWSHVAGSYLDSFTRARKEFHIHTPSIHFVRMQHNLPEISLTHVERMTDSTGMLQHAIFSLPNYAEGYTTDDNARGLIAAVLLEATGHTEGERLASTYLAFLKHAFNPELASFRNFMAYDRTWLEVQGSEDSHARTLWALGSVLSHSKQPHLRGLAALLFEQALPATLAFEHPRPWAFALLGITSYLGQFRGDRRAQQIGHQLAERLLTRYQEQRQEDWHWFGELLSYDNAVLAHALLVSGDMFERSDMRAAGLEALTWLTTLQTSEKGCFAPIGCHGFYRRDGEKARFDQQPIDAHAQIVASLAAYRSTGDEVWRTYARRAFNWFLGDNDLGQALYNPQTGGCRDGLEMDRINQNEGAESTLAFLLSLLELTQDAKQRTRILSNGADHAKIPSLQAALERRAHKVVSEQK